MTKLVLIMVLAASPVLAQPVTARVDGQAAHRYVTTLASPEWQGRRTLTPGFDAAAQWAADRFREWGVTPAGDAGTYFQAVPILGPRSDFAWTVGMPALVVDGRPFAFKESEFLVDPSSTPATDVTAAAVFAGYGISAPAKGLDEYAGLDVTGKIVFVLRGSPKDAPRDLTDFPPDPVEALDADWTSESSDQSKIAAAYAKGAAAVVLCAADPAARQAPAWPKAKVEASPFARPFVVVGANDPHVLRAVLLRDPAETLVGYTDRINRVRRAIQQGRPQSMSTGVTVRVKGYDAVTLYGESFGRNQSRNVLAKIEGSDPVLSRQALVIGAHLDHLGYRSGLVHPGADDNASGSSVVLEVARTMASAGVRPRRTIVFALWCGEENGHHGSKRFTAAPPEGLALDRIVGYINMDMVGLGNGIEAAGALDFPAVFRVMMRDQLPEVARLVKPEPVGPGGSDYAPFIESGVEAISLDSIGGSGHPDYHDAADVASKVQPEMLEAFGQFVLQAAVNLGNETTLTLPEAGRRETCDAIRFAVPDVEGQSLSWWRTLTPADAAQLAAETARAIEAHRARRGGSEADSVAQDGAESLPRLFTGIRAEALDGDAVLLPVAAAALGIGRLDLAGASSRWVEGGLTERGRALLREAERVGLAIHLRQPSAALAADVASSSSRPFLVSALSPVDLATARRVAAKDGLVVVDCRPGDLERCASELQGIRAALGGTSNLLVSMRGAADAGKGPQRGLYKALAANGWNKSEIFAVAGQAPDGAPGGNLSRFLAK